jgi:hypothetical protein
LDYAIDASIWACEDGNITKLKRIRGRMGRFHEICNYFRRKGGIWLDKLSIEQACANGNKKLIQFIHEECGGIVKEDITKIKKSLLREMYGLCRLELIQYLHSILGLTAADLRICNNTPLRCACGNGLFEIVVYLLEEIGGFTIEDIQADNWLILRLLENEGAIWKCHIEGGDVANNGRDFCWLVGKTLGYYLADYEELESELDSEYEFNSSRHVQYLSAVTCNYVWDRRDKKRILDYLIKKFNISQTITEACLIEEI